MDANEKTVFEKLRRAELDGKTEVTLSGAEVGYVLNYWYRVGPGEEVKPEQEDGPRSGFCEDYPCCGHEWGDCFGQKYGSDEDIKAAAVDRMRMEDEGYFFPDED